MQAAEEYITTVTPKKDNIFVTLRFDYISWWWLNKFET